MTGFQSLTMLYYFKFAETEQNVTMPALFFVKACSVHIVDFELQNMDINMTNGGL